MNRRTRRAGIVDWVCQKEFRQMLRSGLTAALAYRPQPGGLIDDRPYVIFNIICRIILNNKCRERVQRQGQTVPITKPSRAVSTTAGVTSDRPLSRRMRSICERRRRSSRKFPPVTRTIAANASGSLIPSQGRV